MLLCGTVGSKKTFVEGAIIDSLSPATRMAIIKPAARDRLISAIKNAVELLSPNIKTLAFELADANQVDHWTGRYVNDKRMMLASNAEEHVHRKESGIKMLGAMSKDFPAKKRPILSICNPLKTNGRNEFQKQLPGVKKEATKYGWHVGAAT